MHGVNEEKKAAAIISCMGPKIYKLLCVLSFPIASEFLKYTEIVDKHLVRSTNKFCGRVKFRKCFQAENESIQNFAARFFFFLMTNFCAFDTLNENLLEQFLRGLKQENIQNKLITQVDHSYFD